MPDPQDFFTAPEILVEIGDFFASCDLQFVGFEENELEETHPIENYEQVRRLFFLLCTKFDSTCLTPLLTVSTIR